MLRKLFRDMSHFPQEPQKYDAPRDFESALKNTGNYARISPYAKVHGALIKSAGGDNSYDFQKGVYENLVIHVIGKNNKITIEPGCNLQGLTLQMIGDNNQISIGKKTTSWQSVLSAQEGTSISIGSDCMISAEVLVVTTDTHSILDEEGVRINPAKDIVIGNHVWLGNSCTILKGIQLGDGSVVGRSSIVTKSFPVGNQVIAGNPAIVRRENITWTRERL